MMSLKSIEAEWDGFSAMVLPDGAPQVQRDEMKKAFFAGAWAIVAAMHEIGEPHISEQQGMDYMTAVTEECERYKKKLMLDYVGKN